MRLNGGGKFARGLLRVFSEGIDENSCSVPGMILSIYNVFPRRWLKVCAIGNAAFHAPAMLVWIGANDLDVYASGFARACDTFPLMPGQRDRVARVRHYAEACVQNVGRRPENT